MDTPKYIFCYYHSLLFCSYFVFASDSIHYSATPWVTTESESLFGIARTGTGCSMSTPTKNGLDTCYESIKVYHFLAKTFSEGQGSLNKNRRDSIHLFLNDFVVCLRPLDCSSGRQSCFLQFWKKHWGSSSGDARTNGLMGRVGRNWAKSGERLFSNGQGIC